MLRLVLRPTCSTRRVILTRSEALGGIPTHRQLTTLQRFTLQYISPSLAILVSGSLSRPFHDLPLKLHSVDSSRLFITWHPPPRPIRTMNFTPVIKGIPEDANCTRTCALQAQRADAVAVLQRPAASFPLQSSPSAAMRSSVMMPSSSWLLRLVFHRLM